jgi:hypothetical protein
MVSGFIAGNGGPLGEFLTVRRTAQDKGSRRFLQTRETGEKGKSEKAKVKTKRARLLHFRLSPFYF